MPKEIVKKDLYSTQIFIESTKENLLSLKSYFS